MGGALLKERNLIYLVLVISFASMLVSGYSLFVAHDTSLPGKGISAYKFSTPEDALKSLMLIEANNDIKAQIEMAEKVNASDRKEMAVAIDDIDIDRVIEHDSKYLLLYKLRVKGLDEYSTAWLEKQDDLYTKTYVSTWEWTTEGSDREKQIANLIEQWEARGNDLDENE